MTSADAIPPPRPLLDRWRSQLLHEVAAAAVPRSVLITRRPDRRRAALTFDDGPDVMTSEYLAVLDRLRVRATFFLVGEQIARAPSLALEIIRRGHEVAGHGFTHRPFPQLTRAELLDELGRTQALLPPARLAASGSATSTVRPLVRPPQGAVTVRSLAQTAAAGYATALWSLDSDDCRTPDPEAVEERLDPRNVRPGEIILLHENQPWTLDALPRAIGRLRAAGFELTTLAGVL